MDQINTQKQIDDLSTQVRDSLTQLLESGPDVDVLHALKGALEEILVVALTLMGEAPCR